MSPHFLVKQRKAGFIFVFAPIFFLVAFQVAGQQLQSGFDKQEYMDLMKVSAQFGDSAYAAGIPSPPGYQLLYRSPVLGLDNRWDLWRDNQGKAIISIRGTTVNEISWLANFYAAMIPAKGQLQLSKDEIFNYQLATDPRAAVHVGWTVALGFLAKDILSKIDSGYKKGARDIVIIGHSQGGAIAYLLTAYLLNLQRQNSFPPDIRLKTYCSAAPKPGNLYFAYQYEAMTQGGWAYNVVNSADWVPQTPFSVQTVGDLNVINPFANAKTFIAKQSWPKRWILHYAYGRLTRPSLRALKNYQKYLGRFVSKSITKTLKGFENPAYFASNDYVRTGNTVVLLADEDYYKKFLQEKNKVFVNHFHQPYLYLAAKLP